MLFFCLGQEVCPLPHYMQKIPFEIPIMLDFHPIFLPSKLSQRTYPLGGRRALLGLQEIAVLRDAWTSVNLLAECPSCALISPGSRLPQLFSALGSLSRILSGQPPNRVP